MHEAIHSHRSWSRGTQNLPSEPADAAVEEEREVWIAGEIAGRMMAAGGDIALNGILGRFLTPRTSVSVSRRDVGVTKYGSTRTEPESVGSSINKHDHYAILTSLLRVKEQKHGREDTG